MSDTAIQVEQLSKRYKLGQREPYKNLREVISNAARAPLGWLKPSPAGSSSEAGYIWALDDISLEIKHGEAVGIIGRNGAGKSTLLKILSRITKPTRGQAEIYGRVGSLLEVGTGFHPELTGRENIYLNGAILGMQRAEIVRKFDEIVDFAEIEQFLDTPVKRYSSGMYVRLAFAVAAHLEPEILLVDEVLAVGDAAFQKKCLGKMDMITNRGRTILFVSHNMTAIQNLCPVSIFLERGNIRTLGSTEKIIKQYLGSTKDIKENNLDETTIRKGTGKARFIEVYLEDENGNRIEQGISGSPLVIAMKYRSNYGTLNNCRVSVAFFDILGQVLFNCSSELIVKNSVNLLPEGTIRCSISNLPLSQSQYIINPFLESNSEILDWLIEGIKVDVIDGDFYHSGKLYPQGWQGKGVLVNHNWTFNL